MLVADIVVETLPGKAQVVAERMGLLQGMGPPVAEGDHRVRATWRVHDCDTVEGLSEVLQAMNPEIVQVYPALLGQDD
jgi:hypothetical protein